MFPTRTRGRTPISRFRTKRLDRMQRSARRAGIRKRVTPHTLRHSWATTFACWEAGADCAHIQGSAQGMRSKKPQAQYLHLSQRHLQAVAKSAGQPHSIRGPARTSAAALNEKKKNSSAHLRGGRHSSHARRSLSGSVSIQAQAFSSSKRFGPFCVAAPQRWAVIAMPVRTAVIRPSHTTRAKTGTAPSARRRRANADWRPASANS